MAEGQARFAEIGFKEGEVGVLAAQGLSRQALAVIGEQVVGRVPVGNFAGNDQRISGSQHDRSFGHKPRFSARSSLIKPTNQSLFYPEISSWVAGSEPSICH